MRRSSIDRRIAVSAVPIASPPALHQIIFRNGMGDIAQRFVVADLGLPIDLAQPVGRAFRETEAATAWGTRRARWNVLKQFGLFLREETNVRLARELDAGVIRRFLGWLARPVDGKRLSQTTLTMRTSLLRTVLQRVEEDNPDLLGSPLAFPHNPFPRSRDGQVPKRRLADTELRAILAACYEEIGNVWAMFLHGQQIVGLPELPPREPHREGQARWVWRLHRLGDGMAPTGEAMRSQGWATQSLKRYGKLDGIARHLHLTPDTMAPFYVALAIQLAANPDPLRLIKRDCLVPHPLDEHRFMVEWAKARAGGKRKRLQRRSFDRRRPFSAPRLVEMLLQMTAPLVKHAPPSETECLFLVNFRTAHHRRHGYAAGVLAADSIADVVERFVERANRRIDQWNHDHPAQPRQPLPSVSPGVFRGSVATAHYVASGGDILVPNAILNHGSVESTDRYIEGPSTWRLERETIARLQGMLVAWVRAPSPPGEGHAHADRPVTALPGHSCLAPMESGANGRPRVCRHLAGCLACPGLVVPLDPAHLAQILHVRHHLIDARDRIDPARWRLFYDPSLRVLDQDLLPAFPTEMRAQADAIVPTLPALPDIE